MSRSRLSESRVERDVAALDEVRKPDVRLPDQIRRDLAAAGRANVR